MTESTHLVVMGVAGCGKSVVGQRVGRLLGLPLVEGDDFHPPSNLEKMARGQALNDDDRADWLEALGYELQRRPDGAVLTCSALKRRYRDTLRHAVPTLAFAQLAITPAESQRRVSSRPGHFYPPSLVASQFEALEDPHGELGVLIVDGTLPIDALAERIAQWLREPGSAVRPQSVSELPIVFKEGIYMSSKAFASQADLTEKKITFEQLSKHCWAYTAEGDPNSGVIIGDKYVMVSDTTATPDMARDLIREIRKISDKPIKYVLLTHYHAVRVLGASAYVAEGATEVIASQGTYELIIERGAQDMKSEMERFPRLFRGGDQVPGLTWPTLVIGGGDATRGEAPGKLTVDLGGVKVQIWSPGHGHTRGDTIAWVEEEKVLFSGDLVEYEAGVYTGDAQLEEWPAALEALRALNAEAIVPGRGEAMKGSADVNKAIDYTKRWVETLFKAGKEAAAKGMDLKDAMAHTRQSMDPLFGHVFIYEHCLPFDVSRAYDEASGVKNPRIWTAERDKEMWAALQN